MPFKGLGPLSSGYLTPDGRAWETVVFQAGKVVIDKDLVLGAELGTGTAQDALKRLMPSGWIADDFLSTSSATSGVYVPSFVANMLELPQGLAHVNGWMVRVEYTNSDASANRVDLGAAPTSGLRTDLVILEVWRRLISAAPDVTGKSPAGRIWLNGNVKIPTASDTTLNLTDDLKDTNVATETTKRVQIQYRLRVIKGVNLAAYPLGMNDPSVLAATVPASSAAPDGVAYTGPNAAYINQSSNGDAGLWRAGDGTPTNGLGTVDGYMYAVPVCAVFRRNSSAFSRTTNQNGAGASPSSGRPDGLYHNMIARLDVLDLRTGVSPTGWSDTEVLTKNINLLLDNNLRTEIVSNPDGGGSQGPTVLRVNEIGGTSSGAGPIIGMFDSVRRRFSDRATCETVVLAIDGSAGGMWTNGRVITISPDALPVYPYAPFDWRMASPAGAQLLDILSMHWSGSAAGSKYENAMPWVVSVTGLGAKNALTITFGNIASLSLSGASLYLTLLISYPRDCGLSHTPVASYGANSFELNAGTLPSASGQYAVRTIDASHREVQIEYTTALRFAYAGSGAAPGQTYRLPERASSLDFAGVHNQAAMSATLDNTGYLVTFAVTPPASQLLQFRYYAVRPIPGGTVNAKMSIYYRSAAPATISDTVLGTSLTVVPRLVAEKLLTITAGSGSQGEAYPFPYAYVQTGGVTAGLNAAEYNGESSMAASSAVSVADFSAMTGMLQLPTYISMVANPESVTFSRSAGAADIEGRTYFPAVSSGQYMPNAYSQNLSAAGRHKNVLPILAELAQDSAYGVRGQLVLVLLVRYAHIDATNGVFFDSSAANTTSASIFRVKGLLLNRRVS